VPWVVEAWNKTLAAAGDPTTGSGSAPKGAPAEYPGNKLKADGGIMATASHNPPQYGGLKIVGFGSSPIGAESGLKEIEKISQDNLEQAKELGKVQEANLSGDYANFVIEKSKASSGLGKLRIVVDAGNGMTPLVLKPLFEKLAIKPDLLYFGIDCSFPNHSPDISRAEALVDLKKRVIDVRADLGIAFDGDGDRIMFVDEKGEIARAEYILALLFNASSSFLGKPKTVYDLRISRSVKELIGLRGIKSRPGHSFMKQVMKANNANIGGELSGHFFFKEMKYVESSVLVMLKILKIISDSGKSLSELVKPFQKYCHSGEINIPIENRERGVGIIENLIEKYKDGKIDELDGVTVEYQDWWFNIRLSNTEPVVRLVIEADTKDLMDQKVKELTEEIKTAI